MKKPLFCHYNIIHFLSMFQLVFVILLAFSELMKAYRGAILNVYAHKRERKEEEQ